VTTLGYGSGIEAGPDPVLAAVAFDDTPAGVHGSKDFREGAQAFRDRQPPVWTGR